MATMDGVPEPKIIPGTKQKISFMKMMKNSFHLGENAKTALMAIGFLSLVMLLSYLYWFA